MLKTTITHRRLDVKLRGLYVKSKDPTPLMRMVAGDMERSTEKNFAAQGRPRWPKLKKGTLNQRKKAGKTGKILQISGQLASSVTTRYTDTYASAGSNKKYARIQNDGGTIKHPGGTPYITTNKGAIFMRKDGDYPKGTKFTKPHDIKLPARPFLRLTQKEQQDIRKRIKTYFSTP